MKASETSFQPIIEGTKQYILPLFQRSYSWDKKEWGVLWDDLIELCEDDSINNHFIGSIVTMPTTSVPEGVTKYLLIDGQQRLTTIFTILAFLRDHAKENNNDDLAEEINNTLLVNPYKKGYDHYKLKSTQVDRESYDRIINTDKDLDKSQMSKAYKFIKSKFNRSNLDADTLKTVITTKLSVVSIVLDPDDNPHLVFESLNAKGRPLSQADLIKNFFFMRIHVEEQDKMYKSYWKPMEDKLGEHLTTFIRHFLMKDDKKVRKRDIYFSLKEIVEHGDALNHLKMIARYSKYYNKFINPKEEENSEIRKRLKRLKRLDVTTAYPFLLNVYNDYENTDISKEDFKYILDIIENFIVRRFICNIPTNQLNKIFPSLYKKAKQMKGDNFLDDIKYVLQTKGYPTDLEFKSRLVESKLYGGGDRRVKTKIILESIEKFYEHKEQVQFNDLSVEHIMPQTLTEKWQDYLGEDWELTHELYLHTIGNLTLTGYNSELSNDIFERKKEYLSESHLELNKYFSDKDKWNKDEIEKRSRYLSDITVKIWPYFGEMNIIESENADVTGTSPVELEILGQRFYDINSWRDVLEQTLNTVAGLAPEKFEKIIDEFPRIVGYNQNKFRAIRKLENGAYIEVSLSSARIQRFCLQAMETIELSMEDWKVKTI